MNTPYVTEASGTQPPIKNIIPPMHGILKNLDILAILFLSTSLRSASPVLETGVPGVSKKHLHGI